MSLGFVQIPKPVFAAAVAGTRTAIYTKQCLVHGLVIVNSTAALAYLQVFDKALTDVTVGTTAPDWVVPLPPSGGVVIPLSAAGFQHFVAVTIAATTTPTGAAGAACDVLMFIK